MNGLVQTLRSLGAVRLILLAGVGAGLVAFFMFVFTRLTTPDFTLLYGELPVRDSGAIANQLEAMAVPYRIGGDGSRILVPSDQVLRLRLRLAEQGLPSGGSIGYELFDEADSLGATRFVQNVNLVRALEGELARTIGLLSRVGAARVHLVLPQRELFQREHEQPSASVFLRLQGASGLSQTQIAAIQHLVAAAVRGLMPERVAIVDDRGNLLASGAEERNEVGFAAARADEFRHAYEAQVKDSLEQLLERSLGPGKVRAEVAAEINFDRTTTNAEVYDPDGQVVRSNQSVEEETTDSEGSGPGSVSVANNLPGGEAGAGPGSQASTARTEETVNFEISRTVSNHVEEGGRVERLSVAVLVDGSTRTDPQSGEQSYVPRTEDELAQIAALARSAIGFDADRGDTIEVINMRFAEPEPVEMPSEPLLGLDKGDYFRIAQILVLALVAVLVILLVLRPLISRLLTLQAHAGEPAATAPGAIPGPRGQPMLTGPEGAAQPGVGGQARAELPAARGGGAGADGEGMIDINKVEGQVKASAVKRMGEIVDKHPDEALSILRGWMAESST